MKKTSVLIVLLFVLVFVGWSQRIPLERDSNCPTKYIPLAISKIVTGNPSSGVTLFEITDLDTQCYKEIRLFVHVMNNSYTTNPFTNTSYLYVSAFHGIGTGSWSYFSDRMPMKFTSEIGGLSIIPVIGNKTRIVVFGYNLPAVQLSVDAAAYLVK